MVFMGVSGVSFFEKKKSGFLFLVTRDSSLVKIVIVVTVTLVGLFYEFGGGPLSAILWV